MDRVRWTIAVNVILIAGVVLLTAVMNRHLSTEIASRRVSFGSCAKQVRMKIAREPINLRIRKPSIVKAKIQAKCGWGNLSARPPADVVGSAFFLVALGLFDLLLSQIWHPKME